MSGRPAFQYQRVLTLSGRAFTILKAKIGEIKAAHPDVPFFYFNKERREVTIFGRTATETIKFSFIASAFLRERGILPSEIQMADPTAITAPLPPVAAANDPGWNVAGSQAAAAAAVPLPPVAAANDPGWNVAGTMAAAQHLPNAVYEKMHANMTRKAALLRGGKRQARKSRKERQSRRSRRA